jgi:hypothetical protein
MCFSHLIDLNMGFLCISFELGGGFLPFSNLMPGLGIIHRNHVLTHISPKSSVQNNKSTLKPIQSNNFCMFDLITKSNCGLVVKL